MKSNNEKKYGKKEDDIISLQFDISYTSGVAFCLGNIHKYLRRFKSDSEKKQNPNDIIKTLDYILRVKEKTKPIKYNGEVIFKRLIRLIKNKEYDVAFIHAIDLQEFLIKAKKKYYNENKV